MKTLHATDFRIGDGASLLETSEFPGFSVMLVLENMDTQSQRLVISIFKDQSNSFSTSIRHTTIPHIDSSFFA